MRDRVSAEPHAMYSVRAEEQRGDEATSAETEREENDVTYDRAIARLHMMADDEGDSWDLSPNDVVAIRTVVAHTDRLIAAIREAHRALMASPENEMHALNTLGAALAKLGEPVGGET